MRPKTDAILLQKMKEDDKRAFRQIFSFYYQPLFLFAQKFVDEDLAKDMVQDCFIELWNRRQKNKISTSLSAYLFTMVKHRCYKQLQANKIKSESNLNVSALLKAEELNFFINSEKSILEFDIKDRIENTLKRLPEKCRNVFVESRFNGLSNKAIAEKFAISVKAVEKHISKALSSFRSEFSDSFNLFLLLIPKIY